MISLTPVYDDVVFLLETQSTQVKKSLSPPLALLLLELVSPHIQGVF